MKTCPACNREYDDEVRFCLEDGTTLVRTAGSGPPTMTMPVASGFQPPPPPPTLAMPAPPSMPVGRTLLNIFIAPARAFGSFRDVNTFGAAITRFLLAAAIIMAAVVIYNVAYQAYFGPAAITEAALEATPRVYESRPEVKEQALQMTRNPTFQVVTLATTFGGLMLFTLVSMPLGALIYWLGGLAFRAPLNFMQALLVWTYATLPARVLWVIVNLLTLFVWPPTSNLRIAMGSGGVFPSNLAWAVPSTTLPLPAWVIALSVFDLFEFYGLTLAIVGLRKAGRLPWWGALLTVAAVWIVGIVWRIGSAGLINLIYK